jgi:hypothetical protein
VGLSKSEQSMLEKLQRKAEEPDAGPIGKSVNIMVNLGDAAQVAMARKFGFLPDDDVDDEGDGEDSDEDRQADSGPKRRGYFGDK